MGVGVTLTDRAIGMATRIQAAWRGRSLRGLLHVPKVVPSRGNQAPQHQAVPPASRVKLPSKWGRMQMNGRLVSELERANMRARWKIEHSAPHQSITLVESAEELADVPIWKQGDDSMYTAHMLKKRYALRHHRLVLPELERWYLTVLRSKSTRTDSTRPDSTIGREEYIGIAWLIFKALVPNYHAREASESAEEDWANDSKGASFLTRTQFQDSVRSVLARFLIRMCIFSPLPLRSSAL